MDLQKFAEIKEKHVVAVKGQTLRAEPVVDPVRLQRIVEQPARPVITAHHPRIPFKGRVHHFVPVQDIIPPVSDEEIPAGVPVRQIKRGRMLPAARGKVGEPRSAMVGFRLIALQHIERGTVGVRLRRAFERIPLFIKAHGGVIGKRRAWNPEPRLCQPVYFAQHLVFGRFRFIRLDIFAVHPRKQRGNGRIEVEAERILPGPDDRPDEVDPVFTQVFDDGQALPVSRPMKRQRVDFQKIAAGIRAHLPRLAVVPAAGRRDFQSAMPYCAYSASFRRRIYAPSRTIAFCTVFAPFAKQTILNWTPQISESIC